MNNAKTSPGAGNDPPIIEQQVDEKPTMELALARRPNGRFEKGQSGNPAGRPLGSGNKFPLRFQQLLEDDAEELLGVLKERARHGDPQALRLYFRLLPVPKERAIALDLEPVEDPMDLPVTIPGIVTAVIEGRLSLTDGERFVDLIKAHVAHVNEKEYADRRRFDELRREWERQLDRQRRDLPEEPDWEALLQEIDEEVESTGIENSKNLQKQPKDRIPNPSRRGHRTKLKPNKEG